jgi:hypothetical protein
MPRVDRYQAHSAPFLQPGDPLAERRLGHVQRARCGAKSPVLHDLGEGKEIVEVVHLEASAVLVWETVRSRSPI